MIESIGPNNSQNTQHRLLFRQTLEMTEEDVPLSEDERRLAFPLTMNDFLHFL